MPHRSSFAPLFITNFFGVFNDNFLKTFAMFILISWIPDKGMQTLSISCAAGALVLPYILCSPLADRMMQHFSKKKIFLAAKWAELPIMALSIAGFLLHSIPTVLFSVFLMGCQSSLYSPAKYALVRDIGGPERISAGLGGLDGFSFLAMLSGTVAASFLIDYAPPEDGYGVLVLFAVLGVLACYTIHAEEEREKNTYPVNPFTFLKQVAGQVSHYRGLHLIILLAGVFWWMAGTIQMGLLAMGPAELHLTSFQTGLILALAAVGITLGNITAGLLNNRFRLLGLVPVTGLIGGILLLVLYWAPLSAPAFSIVLGIFAFEIGFFKLPLDAEIQRLVKGPMLNTVLSYFNQVTFLFILAASGTYYLGCRFLGLSSFLLIGGIVVCLSSILFLILNMESFRFTGRAFLHARYHVTAEHLHLLDDDHAHLILPNHPGIIDPIILCGELYHYPLMPLVDAAFFRIPLAGGILNRMNCVRVPDLSERHSRADVQQVRSLDQTVTEALRNGGNVLLYPAGHITTDGTEQIGNRQLAYQVVRQLPEGTRIVLVRTTGVWGSIWSRCGRKNSPPFVSTLLKSFALYLLTPFRRRRQVRIHLEDRTDEVRSWSQLPRLEFNRKLEAWYNASQPEAEEKKS